MKAQYYNDYDEVVRIFRTNEPQAIMDCIMYKNTLLEADLALKRCNLIKKDKWNKRKWGYETRVYWRKK